MVVWAIENSPEAAMDPDRNSDRYSDSDSDTEILRWTREYLSGGDHPDFRTYAGKLSSDTDLTHFIWVMNHLVKLGRMRDGRVLDIGCGFGWHAVALSMIARAHLVCNDIRPMMTSVVTERVAAIKQQGAPVSIETITADICELDLPAESVDSIVCNQMIEHVRDLEKMFAVGFRLLKRGRVMVITNDNNSLDVEGLVKFEEMWRKRDSDWDYINELKAERPIENKDIKPYAVMREQIVRGADPNLGDDDVRAVVEATAGLVEPDIASVATGYASSGQLPRPPRFSWCRNPVTGEYCERQLDPYDVVEMLRSTGFAPQLRHGFRRWPLSWLNSTGIKLIDLRLFRLRPFFILVARKP